jgi:diguanylate cyclase (GGDEF)-like protein
VVGLVEELWDLHPLAWFEPSAEEARTVVERLAPRRADTSTWPWGTALLSVSLADCAQRFGREDALNQLRRLKPAAWIEETAVANALGDTLPCCEWAASAQPSWIPAGHPVEVRDPLTATLRRHILCGDAWREPQEPLRLDHPSNLAPGVVCIDVDRMKQTNDMVGLLGGDAVLRVIADRLQRLVGDRVVRIAGDGYLVLWEGGAVRDIGERLVEDLQRLVVRNPNSDIPDSAMISVSVSAGTAEGLDLADALRRGELALERAKNAGRGRAEHAN